MSVIVNELHQALASVGVADDLARSAARAVVPVERLVELSTKADLTELRLATSKEIAELKADLLKWGIGTAFGLLAAMSIVMGVLIRFGTVAR